jgi:hypothetical protein
LLRKSHNTSEEYFDLFSTTTIHNDAEILVVRLYSHITPDENMSELD